VEPDKNMESQETSREHRFGKRFQLPLLVSTRKDADGGDQLWNISSGGLCFESSLELFVSDYVLLYVHPKDTCKCKNCSLSLLCRVQWREFSARLMYTYGVKTVFFDGPFFELQHNKFDSMFKRILDECQENESDKLEKPDQSASREKENSSNIAEPA